MQFTARFCQVIINPHIFVFMLKYSTRLKLKHAIQCKFSRIPSFYVLFSVVEYKIFILTTYLHPLGHFRTFRSEMWFSTNLPYGSCDFPCYRIWPNIIHFTLLLVRPWDGLVLGFLMCLSSFNSVCVWFMYIYVRKAIAEYYILVL